MIPVLSAMLAACSALEGAPCGGAVGSCDGTNESLFCLDGRITRIRCDGPRGCSEQGSRLFCDQSVATAGARCAQETAGACTADGTQLLVCTAGRYAASARCRGPEGCRAVDGQVLCDRTRAEVGDACGDLAGGDSTCSMDGDAWLRCREGRFALHRACRGPGACRVEGREVRCDQSLAAAGDACSSDGRGACTPDGAAMVMCTGNRFGNARPCRGARGCYTEGAQVFCDHSLGRAGEPCSPEGTFACEASGQGSLECRGGAFRAAEPCPRGCQAQNGQVACR